MKVHLLLITFLIKHSLVIAVELPKAIGVQYGFIENKGQIIDQNNLLNKEVFYLYNCFGLNVQLKRSGFSYEVIKTESKPKVKKGSEADYHGKFDESENVTIYTHRIDILFIGALPNSKITTSEPIASYINYYTTGTPEVGVTNVHHYKKVLYHNIYPNIDVEFLLSDEKQFGGFKYNFIIHPGGNPKEIQIQVNGANYISLSEVKSILIETDYGKIEEIIPYSYQLNEQNRQEEVKATFKLINYQILNLFGVDVKNYNPSKTVVIDPVPWATYFGGSNSDQSYDIAKDKNGNLLFAGYTNSTSNIATTGSYKNIFSGGSWDVFIAKFSSSGGRIWCTYYGGSGNYDYGFSIAIDTSQNILIAGQTNSDTGIATTGAFQTSIGGNSDAFIAKFNSSGIRLWATYYGGMNLDVAYGIITDVGCNVILVGATQSWSGIASSGAFDTIYSGNNDVFLAKLNQSGNRLWGTYYGSSGNDIGKGVAIDSSSNVLITGSTTSTSEIATIGAYQTTYGGGSGLGDAFVAKFNSAGVISWATYYGGAGIDAGNDVTTDVSKNVCVTGFTSSNTGIATFYSTTDTSITYAGFQTTYGGGNSWYGDAFVTKFTPRGRLVWGTYYGGNGDDRGFGITIDSGTNILFIGCTSSTNNIASTGAHQTYYAGGYGSWGDAFFAKFSANGVRYWGTYYGGTGDDGGCGIVADSVSNVFISGITNSTSGIATSGSFQATNAGGYDAFLSAFINNGTLSVKLTDFSVHRIKNNAIVNWTTAQEINTERFEVERQVASSQWRVVGSIKSIGNSNTFRNYQFTDNIQSAINNQQQTIYYRLRIIDTDGSFSYSKIVSINLDEEAEENISVFPNPFDETVFIKVASISNQQAKITLRDITGKIISTEHFGITSGLTLHSLNDMAALQNGLYFLTIELNGKVQTIKIVKN